MYRHKSVARIQTEHDPEVDAYIFEVIGGRHLPSTVEYGCPEFHAGYHEFKAAIDMGEFLKGVLRLPRVAAALSKLSKIERLVNEEVQRLQTQPQER